MAVPVQKQDEKKTLEDLLALPDDVRAELIDGEIYLMADPTPLHGRAAVKIAAKVDTYEEAKYGPKGPDGFWVLSEIGTYYDLHNTFRHDIAAFWKKDISVPKANRAVKARPFWVCEVLSPSNKKNDLERKRRILEHYNVPYYWIVNPMDKSITVLQLRHPGEPYNLVALTCLPEEGMVRLPPFEEVELDLSTIFPGEVEDL